MEQSPLKYFLLLLISVSHMSLSLSHILLLSMDKDNNTYNDKIKYIIDVNVDVLYDVCWSVFPGRGIPHLFLSFRFLLFPYIAFF